ncbi:GNAT family N-acetyltransferase [uncultured Devosia sp.]|uniref:GNAT family N-acetyltransferase n=1 Tax=uncultured Devosia sp. TaxID=211434 RepID=UPI0035CC5AAF
MIYPSPHDIETAALRAWPGIEVEWDGAWVRRAAGGYTKRANSLQCFDPVDGADARQRLDLAVEWFRARALPPVVRSTPLDSPALNAVLDANGWTVIDHSHLYATPIGAPEPDAQGRISSVLDPQFLAAQQGLRGYDDATLARLRALLAAMAVPAAGIVVHRDGAPVATGLMAVADGIVVAGNVITDPGRRRQGLAAAMMQTGLAWAKAQGAHTAALNVQAGNAAAKALYASLGYRHRYDYAYRVPGPP